MVRGLVFSLVVAGSSIVPALGGGFRDLPKSVWDIKEDPAKGLLGAQVLEDHIWFRGGYVEHLYRVRIFGESGRSGMEIAEFPSGVTDVEGRTVYPDGRILTYNSKKDFATKVLASGDNREKRTVLIPPGVTNDCVVELSWKEVAHEHGKFSPLPSSHGYYSSSMVLANRFPTRELTVEFAPGFKYAYAPTATRTQMPEVTSRNGYRILTYRDIPGMEPVPYALDVTRDFPRLRLYWIPEILGVPARDSGSAFWKAATEHYFQPWYQGDVKKDRSYKALFEELWNGLSGSDIEQATELIARLNARIRNTSYPTFAESDKKEFGTANIDSQDLGAAARRGFTDEEGMLILYLNLLMDHGLKPKIARVADRDFNLFSFETPDAFQFRSALVGFDIPGGKGTWWVEPGRRFMPPGIVHPDYQGTPALLLNTANWTATSSQISAQGPATNTQRFQVEVVGEEEEDRFNIQATFQGYPDYRERMSFLGLDQGGRTKELKERLEGSWKRVNITSSEILGVEDGRKGIAWKASGKMEQEEGRIRVLHPFPCLPWALQIPDAWPTTREVGILIPYLRTHEAVSTIHLPAGWHWGGSDPYEHRNRFGSVSWTAESQADGTVRVSLKVQATGFYEQASAYEGFKTFLAWVQEASGRTLALTRKGGV